MFRVVSIMEDPFHTVKAEVTKNVGSAETIAARYEELRKDRSQPDECARLRAELDGILQVLANPDPNPNPTPPMLSLWCRARRLPAGAC